MAIFKRAGTILLTGVATAALIGLSVPSLAGATTATTFKVSPGGKITATAGKTTLKDTKTGTTLSCKSSKASGTLKKGSGLAGAGIGSITALSFTTCTGPLGLTFTVKSANFPWKLNAVSKGGGVTHGNISGIHATLSGPSCKATVDGTGSTKHNGKVNVTYTNSTGILKVLTSGGNLHIYNVSGCAGLIHSGNTSTFSGSYKVSPKQKITRS
jgi:hypothetical protein